MTPTTPTQGEMRLVPVEPTEAMLDAMFAAYCRSEGSYREAYRSMLAAAPSAPVVGREEIARLAEMAAWFERGDDGAKGSVMLSASVADEHASDIRAIISVLYSSPDALSECLSALRAIKANGGDPEDVNRATCAIERVEALHASPDIIDPRLTAWGYSTTDEAITHLGQLLEDQAAFDGLASPDKMEKGR